MSRGTSQRPPRRRRRRVTASFDRGKHITARCALHPGTNRSGDWGGRREADRATAHAMRRSARSRRGFSRAGTRTTGLPRAGATGPQSVPCRGRGRTSRFGSWVRAPTAHNWLPPWGYLSRSPHSSHCVTTESMLLPHPQLTSEPLWISAWPELTGRSRVCMNRRNYEESTSRDTAAGHHRPVHRQTASPTLVDSMDGLWTPQERAAVEMRLEAAIVGGPATVGAKLAVLLGDVKADEVIFVSDSFRHAD